MIKVLVIAAAVAAMVVTGATAAGVRFGGGGGKWPPVVVFGGVTSIKFDPDPIRYQVPPTTSGNGDAWFPTWADDGKTYITLNDGYNFQYDPGHQNAIGFGWIDRWTFGAMGTMVGANPFAKWGDPTQHTQTGGTTAKNAGLICVKPPGAPHGYLYLNTRRLEEPGWTFVKDTQIIKSHDYGLNWEPIPPQTPVPGQPYPNPMFPSDITLGGYFQFGKCYDGAGVDGTDTYIYAGLSEAFENRDLSRGTSTFWLGRVRIDRIDNLNAADWSFYKGPPGGDGLNNANWGTWAEAIPAHPVFDAVTQFGPSKSPPGGFVINVCCGQPFQYLPRYHQYLYMAGGGDEWMTALIADHPWGPWTVLSQFRGNQPQQGWWGTIPASLVDGGRELTIASNGDVIGPNGCCSLTNPNITYSLFFRHAVLSP